MTFTVTTSGKVLIYINNCTSGKYTKLLKFASPTCHPALITKSYNVNNKIRLNFKMKLNRHRKIFQRYIIDASSVTSTQNGIVKININALGIQNDTRQNIMNNAIIHVHPSLVRTSRLQFTPIRLDLLNCHPAHQHQLSRYTKKKIQLNTNRNGAFIKSDNSTRSEVTSSN